MLRFLPQYVHTFSFPQLNHSEGLMNIKRFLSASIGVFITNQITDPIIHGPILADFYADTSHIWRTDMMSKMWLMFVISAIFSTLFVFIYTKANENKGVFEGARYGLVIGLMMNSVHMFSQYVVYPIPLQLVVLWFVFTMMQFILYGIVTALIYKPS